MPLSTREDRTWAKRGGRGGGSVHKWRRRKRSVLPLGPSWPRRLWHQKRQPLLSPSPDGDDNNGKERNNNVVSSSVSGNQFLYIGWSRSHNLWYKYQIPLSLQQGGMGIYGWEQECKRGRDRPCASDRLWRRNFKKTHFPWGNWHKIEPKIK